MRKFGLDAIKWTIMICLIVPLLAACGQFDLSESYPLESVTREGQSTSYIYRAAGTSVPDAAQAIADKRKPEQISENSDERMFLVYRDELIQIQQDPNNPEDSLIEVDSKEYVRQNYDRSFLETYITYKILDSLFDSVRGYGQYRGYTDRGNYAPAKPYRKPTVEDKKKAPPITVDRKGSIFRRGSDKDTTVGSGGSIFTREPSDRSSKGSITRNRDGGGSSQKYNPPKVKKYKPPKTRVGSGSIFRRGRR
ncbi:DUF4247 domain-containing protein [Paenibacillus apiarius]|uniref:DUF4247 domain-containing protein n=1 Tax=Paenibacillus apiarius TaxID=46240 RepID=UPI00197EE5D3|nr:DUF4247 domain-containing protein [Paenibacillus apiarius]MBN3527412.1 DUF4247 domain-containing protein [Paenibacillus apiarius]